MAELANCSRCGKVYVKTIRDVCHDCYKYEEEAFQKVYTFLREQRNREATMVEIVDQTGVEEELISKFVREGRLRPSEFPKLTYPCERCHSPIQSGRYCKSCMDELKKDLEIHEEQEKKAEERKRENIYVSFNKDRE